MLKQPGREIIETLGEREFRITKRNPVETIRIKLLQRQVVHQSEILPVPRQRLARTKCADIMDPCFKFVTMPAEGLQVAAGLTVFLEDADIEPFFAQDIPAKQSSQPGTDNDHIELIHTPEILVRISAYHGAAVQTGCLT